MSNQNNKHIAKVEGEKIVVKGARTHNLKNISLELPRNKMIVFTGLSGSGKSSLAFDTIFAEGQRRYVESLSPYARQFLNQLQKPDVDEISGLSPAIAIDQKSRSNNPRSTVATITEIYDYLRVLYARVGQPHCVECGTRIRKMSNEEIINIIFEKIKASEKPSPSLSRGEGQNSSVRVKGVEIDTRNFEILAPVVRGRKGEYYQLLYDMLGKGYTESYVDGEKHNLREQITLEKNKKHNISILIDTIGIQEIKNGNKDAKTRLSEAIENALELAEGLVEFSLLGENIVLSSAFACSNCGFSFPEVEPRLFSFNSPYGACATCNGLGVKYIGALDNCEGCDGKRLRKEALNVFLKTENKNETESETAKKLILNIKKIPVSKKTEVKKDFDSKYKFVYEWTDKVNQIYHKHKHLGKSSIYILNGEVQMNFENGESCLLQKGDLLEVPQNSWHTAKVGEKGCEFLVGQEIEEDEIFFEQKVNIVDVTNFTIEDAKKFFKNLDLTEKEMEIAKVVLREILDRLDFLLDVGLDYLQLNRKADTLSGGESQRIRLASQLGSKLVGALYVLDEPTIGLHQRDNEKLIKTLLKLRDLGNTILVVEHDEDTAYAADFLVDIGPGAGVHGGNVVVADYLNKLLEEKTNKSNSITLSYLREEEKVYVPKVRREADKGSLVIKNGNIFNIKNLNTKIPLGKMTCITGVSGSGKSTFMYEIINRNLDARLERKSRTSKTYNCDVFAGVEGNISRHILIDQSSIGRTSRSNPATYTGAWSFVRDLFAETTEARVRGWKASRFSFNVEGGRCETCQGNGEIAVEMHFLPTVYVLCDVCNGKRFMKETLEVKFKGKNVYEILDMTVEEAEKFFIDIPAIHDRMKTLMEVGLGYLKLGQSATTLSGGEAQRVKISSELYRPHTERTMYLLDEPTVGLHFEDVRKLIEILNKLVDKGNTVMLIEHNLDVIKCSDWVIDIGPEGGVGGGKIVAQGTPEYVASVEGSHTGRFLKKVLRRDKVK
jgi:excinuclease ABC subunit A